MDYTSDDTPARDLAFDSESENSHFEEPTDFQKGKDAVAADGGGVAGFGSKQE